MRNWFKGFPSTSWAVDFETKTTCYEVKSCNLFNKCNNANDKREYVNKPHKKIVTHQFGRFLIDLENHYKLQEFALSSGKKAKYIFVVVLGNQKIFKVKEWDKLKLPLLKQVNSNYYRLSIESIFSGKKV